MWKKGDSEVGAYSVGMSLGVVLYGVKRARRKYVFVDSELGGLHWLRA